MKQTTKQNKQSKNAINQQIEQQMNRTNGERMQSNEPTKDSNKRQKKCNHAQAPTALKMHRNTKSEQYGRISTIASLE
jgi:hypothetical protein